MAETGSIANGVADLALEESAIPDGLEDLINQPDTEPAEPAKEDTEPARSVTAETVTDDLFSTSGKSESDSETKEHKLGLDINFPWGWAGSKYNDYDLVTVHGIRDDYKTAWIDKDGNWWAKDELFKDLSVREVDYSYEIDEDSVLYEPNGIKRLAEKLVTEYADVRGKLEETETDRPILWICHDIGGTIVKEALAIALSNPQKYGRIALLSTAIIFLGTPHRSQSIDDLEDQLHRLILLPGPEIRTKVFSKVQHLAKQITNINDNFLATKLLDRAAIFNIFSQNIRDSLKGTASDRVTDIDSDKQNDIDEFNTVTPFPRYVHFAGQSFESAGRIRVQPIDHIDLVRGDPDDEWITGVSDILNIDGCLIKVDYRIIQIQGYILSLAPPTRGIDTPFDPVAPKPPVVKWLYDQDIFKKFSKPGTGLRVLHIYGSGNRLIDMSKSSRLVYVDYNSSSTATRFKRSPQKTTVYFEFDKWDSRYNDISSMLLYFINILVWNFWTNCLGNIIEELGFMEATKSCTLDDLYHVYTTLRDCVPAAQRLTIFISCFDQCPEEQRKWFLDRLFEEQTYTETEYRLIFSTSGSKDLTSDYLPNEISIDLNDCPEVAQAIVELPEELRIGLGALVEKRHIYEDVRPELEGLLKECGDAPHLGRILLRWLGRHLRGKPRPDIVDAIKRLTPVTASNVLDVFISSLAPTRQARAATIFNWVKHAAEPWSPESLAEAITVDECKENEPYFEDLDIESMIQDIEETFCGIIVVQNRDIKFSHPSFYSVPDIGVEGSTEEREDKVHSSIASTCLRYLQFKCARDQLFKIVSAHLVEGPEEPVSVSPPFVYNRRTSMADYAVRFWPQHYRASGKFKPVKLVNDLFASKAIQAVWAAPFWLMSHPFTRLERTLNSRLPVFAMLGLQDLVNEALISDKDTPSFEKDCWIAILEAARVGYEEIALQLLDLVTPNDEELATVLAWAAPSGNSVILDALVKKMSNLESFKWKEKLLHRVAAAGIDSLMSIMLKSGCDVNETYDGTLLSPTGMAASRNQLSTMKLLLSLDTKPDFYVKTTDGDFPMLLAISKGNPGMIELMLQEGVKIETEKNSERESGIGPAQIAVKWCRHKALAILIQAGADFKTGKTDADAAYFEGPPLIVAADQGLQECVQLLLDEKADEDVDWSSGTALYNAVAENHIDVVRTLLKHERKPDMNVTPEGQEALLMRAVISVNTELISLLIENGAEVDFVDPNCSTFCKTPLSRACYEGDLDIVKLLLEKGASVNFTGDGSDAALFTAFYENQVTVGKHILEQEGVDVMWVGADGMGSLHAAFNHPDIILELLKRGVPIDGHGIYGTALQMAARDGFPKSIEVLLKHDPKPDLEFIFGENGAVPEEIGYTALQLACSNAAPKCVKLLLDAGSNPEFRNKNGDDALDILIKSQKDPKGTTECVELLLSKRYTVSLSSVDENGQGRLHKIGSETPLSIIKMLVESKAPFDSPDQDGYTPLAHAVRIRSVNVAEYLLDQGASPRTIGPKFGSILHIAVSIGSLTLVKLLLKAGADCETVHPEYGESLLHAALGISNGSALKKMVRYLVDEVKVPVDKLGGEFSYPIIRAAYMTKMNYLIGLNVLKFLIRRKAQLNVADKQGRRAVHIACGAFYDRAIKALVDAGADINAKDKFGRLPIHFAASAAYDDALLYLLNKFEDIDIEAKDYDKWTPLLWAARTGDIASIEKLVDRGADVWARGGSSYSRTEWSALKLVHFANRPAEMVERVTPKELSRVNSDGETEQWDEYFHKSKSGHKKEYFCDSCLADIIGIQWKCIECMEDWSLCFKCAGNRAEIHNPEHSFEEVEPWYDETANSASPVQEGINGEHDAPELPVEFAQDVVEGDANGVVNGELGHEALGGDVEPDFDLGAAS